MAVEQAVFPDPSAEGFNIMDYVADGPMDTWTDDEWDIFSELLNVVSLDEQDKLWLIMEERDVKLSMGVDEEVVKSEEKDIMSMTDAEWEAFAAALEGDTATVTSITVKADCTCKGPGSDQQQFTTHTFICPAWATAPNHERVAAPAGYKSGSVVPATYTPVKKCDHDRDVVKLNDGLSVFASAYRDTTLSGEPYMDMGLYMYSSWLTALTDYGYKITTTPDLEFPWATEKAEPLHPGIYMNWPDYGQPNTPVETMLEIVDWVFAQVKDGKNLEIGCMGGHGRTGTLIGVMLAVQGVDPLDTVQRVWSEYCTEAIETASQCSYIAEVYTAVHGHGWIEGKKGKKRQAEYAALMHENYAPKYQTTFQSGGTYKYPGKNLFS